MDHWRRPTARLKGRGATTVSVPSPLRVRGGARVSRRSGRFGGQERCRRRAKPSLALARSRASLSASTTPRRAVPLPQEEHERGEDRQSERHEEVELWGRREPAFPRTRPRRGNRRRGRGRGFVRAHLAATRGRWPRAGAWSLRETEEWRVSERRAGSIPRSVLPRFALNESRSTGVSLGFGSVGS